VFGIVRMLHGFLPLLQRSAAPVVVNASTGRTGTQTVEQGAEIIVRMAQVGQNGPTGRYFDATGPLAW
jgi:hypothetical protein